MMEKLIIDTLVLNATRVQDRWLPLRHHELQFTYNMQTSSRPSPRSRLKRTASTDRRFTSTEKASISATPRTTRSAPTPRRSTCTDTASAPSTTASVTASAAAAPSPTSACRASPPDSSPIQRLHQRQPALAQPAGPARLYSDWILVGLTGNLRDYTFTDSPAPPSPEPKSTTTASPPDTPSPPSKPSTTAPSTTTRTSSTPSS